jgi:hypothetical protein
VNRLCHSLCLLGTLLAASACPAAGPASGPAYNLVVVLDIAKSRAFTDPFRQQVERELREGLQAALGSLAVVKVTSEHELLPEIRAVGLGKALDSWKKRSDTKTHFVLIDLINNKYEVRARQFDGPTGMPSPVVRTARTPDRAFVARTAGLLIEQDFGFTATFDSWPGAGVKAPPREGPPAPEIVRLKFLGAAEGVPLSQWVKPNDVFAVVHMYRGNRAPDVMQGALVQIQDGPRDDDPEAPCTGRLYSRYLAENIREGPDHDGYRCVKLGAISAPVHLRFLQLRPNKTRAPLTTPLTIEVRQRGFTEQAGLVTGITEGGYYSSDRNDKAQPFDRVAFVTVLSGSQRRAFIPLALVDNHTEVVVLPPATDTGDALARDLARWKEEVNMAARVQTEIFKDLNEMAEKADTPRAQIVKLAQAGLARTEDDWANLDKAKEKLVEDAKAANATPPDLREQEDALRDLKRGEKKLKDYVKEQEDILNRDSDPRRKAAQAMVADAGLEEEKAEYGKAIALYRKAMDVITDDKSLAERVKKLEAEWKPRDAAHGEARDFIYNKWPKLDTAGLEAEMANARKALQVCKSFGDTLYPRKLVLATQAHTARLQQESDAALKKGDADDDKTVERLAKVSDQLKKLLTEALDYLKSASE